ncbi:MAG: type I methionyl aminopeptidase [Candidatus Nealsonbacteria bacterium]|nr:type I methionyl aminopeptidase [Candidatus Nealsonbacteria bacterium]
MIKIKTKEEIRIMAEGAKILSEIMGKLEKKISPGITTKELDKVAQDLVFKSGAKPSFKGYDGFPACLCASINEQIVHGVPSDRELKEGDILSLDLGIFYKEFHSDMALTLPVGKVDFEKLRLIRVTKKSLKIGIKKAKPGNKTGDIENTIQRYVESQGFNVVRELCGHGIGRQLHEDPQILNYGKRGTGFELKEGMVLCLEPMVTMGDWRIKRGKDGFVYETLDGSLSCHFESEIAITQKGNIILTDF